jgi:hypothetical protein
LMFDVCCLMFAVWCLLVRSIMLNPMAINVFVGLSYHLPYDTIIDCTYFWKGWHHAQFTIFQSQIRIMIHLARLILTEVFSFYLFLCSSLSLERGLSFDLAAGRSYCEPHISRSDILNHSLHHKKSSTNQSWFK